MGNVVEDVLWAAGAALRDWWQYRHDARPRLHGLHLYTGLPGDGKTISMVAAAADLKARYGAAVQVITNFELAGQDGSFDGDWTALLDVVEHSDRATLIAIDELGTLLSARNWAEMPPEVLSLATMRRKLSQGRGCRIIGTVQRLWMTDKVLRELADAIVICRSIWGRLVFQSWYAAGDFDAATGLVRPDVGPFTSRRVRLVPALWDRYDTYKLIRKLMPAQDVAAKAARTQRPEPMPLNVVLPGANGTVQFSGDAASWAQWSKARWGKSSLIALPPPVAPAVTAAAKRTRTRAARSFRQS